MRHILTRQDKVAGGLARFINPQTEKHYCLFCGNEFKTYPSKLKRGKGKYCSRSCASKHQLMRERHEKRNGYVYIKNHDHPFRTNQNLVAEHRLVIEGRIGRYLDAQEIPHHIDLDKKNNRSNNLYLCSNDLMHRKIHKICPGLLFMVNAAIESIPECFTWMSVFSLTRESLTDQMSHYGKSWDFEKREWVRV